MQYSISDIRACKSSLKHLSCELNIITKIFVRKNSGIEYFFKENEGYLVFYDYTKYHDVPCRLSYHFQQDIIRTHYSFTVTFPKQIIINLINNVIIRRECKMPFRYSAYTQN